MKGYTWTGADAPANPKRCPRCTGWIPNDATPGAYTGAMSRYLVPDADGEFGRNIEICSACGEDEAMGNGVVPPHLWPLEGQHDVNEANRLQREEHLKMLEEWKNSPEGQAAIQEHTDDDEGE